MDPEKAAVNQRLESIGWGAFLVRLGGFLLVWPQSDKRQPFGLCSWLKKHV